MTKDPLKHKVFEELSIHTTKCDCCEDRNRDIIRRCKTCSFQVCTKCFTSNPSALNHGYDEDTSDEEGEEGEKMEGVETTTSVTGTSANPVPILASSEPASPETAPPKIATAAPSVSSANALTSQTEVSASETNLPATPAAPVEHASEPKSSGKSSKAKGKKRARSSSSSSSDADMSDGGVPLPQKAKHATVETDSEADEGGDKYTPKATLSGRFAPARTVQADPETETDGEEVLVGVQPNKGTPARAGAAQTGRIKPKATSKPPRATLMDSPADSTTSTRTNPGTVERPHYPPSGNIDAFMAGYTPGQSPMARTISSGPAKTAIPNKISGARHVPRAADVKKTVEEAAKNMLASASIINEDNPTVGRANTSQEHNYPLPTPKGWPVNDDGSAVVPRTAEEAQQFAAIARAQQARATTPAPLQDPMAAPRQRARAPAAAAPQGVPFPNAIPQQVFLTELNSIIGPMSRPQRAEFLRRLTGKAHKIADNIWGPVAPVAAPPQAPPQQPYVPHGYLLISQDPQQARAPQGYYHPQDYAHPSGYGYRGQYAQNGLPDPAPSTQNPPFRLPDAVYAAAVARNAAPGPGPAPVPGPAPAPAPAPTPARAQPQTRQPAPGETPKEPTKRRRVG
ncbi:hypothetical protein BU16DRAFT_562410 [Lophium mytilinum]|uniref:Uncharacterized protein n=1 Tax=Lophium mytilinum TaxID=390894 RepID=A0A6A6QQV7_9PEZI|nr:hypothetical protein BU16DRAFT_562410 [Lophium mytilinum]